MGQIRHALNVLIARRDALTQVIEQLTPLAEPESTAGSPEPERQKGKRGRKPGRKAAKATRRAKAKRAPKAQATAAPAPAAAPTESGRGSGRQPSPASAACRSAVLLALLAAPNAQSFTQIRDSIAGVMKKNGVPDDEALGPLLQMTQTVLRQKGFIERAAGAWKLTDAGRDEALRIRAAVKKAA